MYYNNLENRAYEEPATISFTSDPSAGGRTGRRTLTSEPKFLGSMSYQICLPMVLHELRYHSTPTALHRAKSSSQNSHGPDRMSTIKNRATAQ